MENKKHFKLYKDGKKWCVAAITAVGVTTVMTFASTQRIKADTTIPKVRTQQVVVPQAASNNNAEKQEVTVVPQAKIADNGSGNVASYDQNNNLQSYTVDSQLHQAEDTTQQVPANNISTISINGDLSGISKDNLKTINTQINLNSGQTVNAWGTIKYQGNSTLAWPKKGYRLKLYQDAALTKKLKLEIPGSGFKTNAFNLKANFTDPNKGNNVINSELFKQITASRSNLKESIVKKMPNYGQIAGIPISLTINGLNMGLYSLNTYHQDKLYKMNDEKANDIAITGEGYSPVTGFQQPVTAENFISDSAFSNVSPAKVTQATIDRFNELYQVANASENDYLRLEQQYIDVPSAIDYLVFSFAINNADGLRKNIFYLSKDGSKWTLMPYDLDMSWANSWDGNTTDEKADFSQTLNNSGNKLLINIYNHHRQEIINRYKELRQSVLSTANVIALFNQWFDSVGEKNYQINDQLWNQYNMDGSFTHRAYLPKQELFKQINSWLKTVDDLWEISTPDTVIELPETKSITRTIELNEPNGNKKVEKQVVTFKRTSHFDTANDRLTAASQWTTDQNGFSEYSIPVINGYSSLVNNRLITKIDSLQANSNMDSSIIKVNYVSNSFDKSQNTNIAWLDTVQLINNSVHIAGWHVTNQVATHPYHYIIVFDKTNNKELGRVQVTVPTNRPDVKQAYNLYNAEYSGFNVNVPLNMSSLSNSSDELVVISRYSNDTNGEGNYIEYWNPSIKLDQSNNSALDSFDTSADNTLRVTGWHATNLALTKPYHFVILFDQTTGKEVGRQRVLNSVRADVQKVLPDIGNSLLSGFTADFDLNGLDLSHSLQAISRYSDDINGEGNYIDSWFNPAKLIPSKQQNIGYLDSFNVSDGQLQVSGWHAADMTSLEKNHYLILFDNTSNTQVISQKISNVMRSDVAQVYSNIQNANWAGFNVNLGKVTLLPGHSYSLVSRYSTASIGNGNSGMYTDYWFTLPQQNQQAYSIDNVFMTNDGLHLTGWMASDYSAVTPNAYLIVLSNGQEIGRQKVNLTDRADVANVYPTISNSLHSGFDSVVKVNTDRMGDSLQVLLRFTGSDDGNSNYYDQLSSAYPTNAGWFDQVMVDGQKVSFAGWHIDDRTIDKPFQYVILLKNGSEVARVKLDSNEQNLTRPDVKQAYPSIYNSENAGFSGSIVSPIDLENSNIQLIYRFTSSDDGNSNYVDYYSPVIKK